MTEIAQHDPAPVRAATNVAAAAQLACLLEASAQKPGNVAPLRHFVDARYEDFLASAVAIGPALQEAGSRPLGETIRDAVQATRLWTASNTNLGIVLLLAPLARAACLAGNLRESLRGVLESTTVNDARDAYAAIRAAGPGGLGRAGAQDVFEEPTVTLLEAMRLAADRDGIAREYVTTYEITFDVGVRALETARADGLEWDDAVVETYLALLARAPDTHVIRRAGAAVAAKISRRAREVIDLGGVRSAEGRRALEQFDAGLRAPGNPANPGTTADVTAAAIFIVLIEGGFSPRGRGEGHGAPR
jgi:triphosphoribosyl-dephospho-CoA synthase